MSLPDIAEELYGLPLEQFTGARNEQAKATRKQDRALADAVKALPKPALAAWVVNQLVRRRSDEVAQLLEVGASLRQAQADLDAERLRALTRQRRQLTAAMSRQARGVAADLGQRVSDAVEEQVEQTLHAAMVDESAAAAVRSGLLVAPLTATGVGPVDLTGAVAMPQALGRVAAAASAPATGPPELKVVRDEGRALREAQEAADAAEAEAQEAQKTREHARGRVDDLQAGALQIQGELDELRRRAAELEHRLDELEEEQEEALAELAVAEQEARRRQEEATEARRRLKRLRR